MSRSAIVGEAKPEPATPKKTAPWKTALRLVVALGLVAAVIAYVPWHDRLTWPRRFGEAKQVGHIVEDGGAPSGDLVRFVIDQGAHAGDEYRFEARGGQLRVAARVGSETAATDLALEEADRAELAKQPEAGLHTTLTRLWHRPDALFEAMALYVIGAMLSFQRWQVLLKAVGVNAGFWRVQKLGYFGLFFSNIIPGMTGGDLVKAIMVARDHPEQRPAAVLSVIVDRAIGLLGLAIVASAVLLMQHGRYPETELKLNIILGLILAGVAVVMSRRIRRAIHLDKLLGMLPGAALLKKLDKTALLYRDARGALAYAVVASFCVHGLILTGIGILGRALGIEIRFVDYFALAPLALIGQSLPITPGGVGIGESMFIYFFAPAGVARAAAMALSVSYRLLQMLVSMIGGVLLLMKHEKPVTQSELESGAA